MSEDGEDFFDEDDPRCDPLFAYVNYPDSHDQVERSVDFEIRFLEEELLGAKDHSCRAYNTLVLGGALLLFRSEAMSDDLRNFLFEHLIEPKPPNQPMKLDGRRTYKNDERLKYIAIEFAVQHGLTLSVIRFFGTNCVLI
ncbi:hypothetical protein K3X41_10855 [Aliiroseovarius crassostreae]|uniref:hypothetical protein n=1 Tax=Aliiroseovarius crassostreae TaxID=154981 RepID=UPI00220D7FAA|nr:hypothetical protein [Aliiroseovarius crassostreae]UWQ10404.1 hypothetical protein K3X41_10855 [Aliiroseovarius crassostreae]